MASPFHQLGCCICERLTTFEGENSIARLYKCGHLSHETCALIWAGQQEPTPEQPRIHCLACIDPYRFRGHNDLRGFHENFTPMFLNGYAYIIYKLYDSHLIFDRTISYPPGRPGVFHVGPASRPNTTNGPGISHAGLASSSITNSRPGVFQVQGPSFINCARPGIFQGNGPLRPLLATTCPRNLDLKPRPEVWGDNPFARRQFVGRETKFAFKPLGKEETMFTRHLFVEEDSAPSLEPDPLPHVEEEDEEEETTLPHRPISGKTKPGLSTNVNPDQQHTSSTSPVVCNQAEGRNSQLPTPPNSDTIQVLPKPEEAQVKRKRGRPRRARTNLKMVQKVVPTKAQKKPPDRRR